MSTDGSRARRPDRREQIENPAAWLTRVAGRVARFLLGLPHLEPTATIEQTHPEGLAFLVRLDGRANSVISVDVAGDRVIEVYLVRNPDKLTLWR